MSLKNFSLDEFNCQVTGENRMEQAFLEKLDALRTACGFAFVITSGYRHPTEHYIEAAKEVPGTHAQGIAADIKTISSAQRHRIVSEAMKLGFTGVGVASNFVHVDTRGTTPIMWLY
jgi:uncharacterized protein YcbK (DUF882 family)|tara:strand:- start:4219 stop:4569 length:351 start_codon:yes stop_codon:yes gene_type:complete